MPIMTPGDRRAALRSLWSDLLPMARWESLVAKPIGTAQVYLDVSGSMRAEMPLLVSLLGRLSPMIRKPLWAFSDQVARARIENGRLIAETTGGTSMSCVLAHLADTRPPTAVVVTDGYIEALEPRQLESVQGTRIEALVTRDGDPSQLIQAGISTHQLSEVPA